jgi:hypothetical protein
MSLCRSTKRKGGKPERPPPEYITLNLAVLEMNSYANKKGLFSFVGNSQFLPSA